MSKSLCRITTTNWSGRLGHRSVHGAPCGCRKLETQAIRVREKWRDGKRAPNEAAIRRRRASEGSKAGRRENKHSGRSKPRAELVIITGMSGSGKGSVLRALEDQGYYSVDNLPVDLIPKFAELVRDSASIRRAALVVDVREGVGLKQVSRHLPQDPQQPRTSA